MRVWPRTKRARGLMIGLALLGGASLLVFGQPRARTALRFVRGFSPLEVDARVFYEVGAEDLAKNVASALPAAVVRVEDCQGEPFDKPFRIYVCASHENFTRHIGEPRTSPTRGIAFLRDIWISPRAFSFRGADTHRETLAHELSHLHLGQKLGWWHRTREVPSWFQEGLADWVADTGAEQVSREEARRAILGGRCIVPEGSGHLPFPKQPRDFGLSWPMFHRQSRMFVEYLRSRDADGFAGFVGAVVRGGGFEAAFNDHFPAGLPDVWRDFTNSFEVELP